jgi:hypothetical protein
MRDHLAVRDVAGMRTVFAGDRNDIIVKSVGDHVGDEADKKGYDWRGEKAQRRRRFEQHTKQKWKEYHSDLARTQRIKDGFIRWGERHTDDCDTGWDALSWFEIVQEETQQKFPIVHCIAWLKMNGIVPWDLRVVSNEKHHEIVAAVNAFDETSMRGRYEFLRIPPKDLQMLVRTKHDHAAISDAITHLQFVLADV